MTVETPAIEYARSGDVNVAYQVFGDGPIDVVMVPGGLAHLEATWEFPPFARFIERFTRFARVIRFDKRGTGLSDRMSGEEPLETRMDDVRAHRARSRRRLQPPVRRPWYPRAEGRTRLVAALRRIGVELERPVRSALG